MELDSSETSCPVLTPVTSDEPRTPLPGSDPPGTDPPDERREISDEKCGPAIVVTSPASSVTLDFETPLRSPSRNDLLRPDGFPSQHLELRIKKPASVEEEVEPDEGPGEGPGEGPDEGPKLTLRPLDTSVNASETDFNIPSPPSPDSDDERSWNMIAEEYADSVIGGAMNKRFEDTLKRALASRDSSNWVPPDEIPSEITMPCGQDFRPGTPRHFEDLPLVEPICYRQNEEGEVCGLYAKIGCPDCHLIAYCTLECQMAHADAHKCRGTKVGLYSNIADRSGLSPEDPSQWRFPWAPWPAIDILQLQKNEGAEFDGFLNILLTGGPSLRTLVNTIANIPETANPTLHISCNEVNLRHVAHTLAVLLLLTDRSCEDRYNAEAAVNLWYSSAIPNPMMKHIQVVALGPILDAVRAAMRYYLHYDVMSIPIRFPRGNCSIVVNFTLRDWQGIFLHVSRVEKTNIQKMKRLRFEDRKYCENINTRIQRAPHMRILGMLKWETDGMLLPYGLPLHKELKLNPFLVTLGGFPVPGSTTEPVTEWPMSAILGQDSGPATNDVYGKMFYFVRSLCLKFQRRLRSLQVEFSVMQKDPLALPAIFNDQGHRRFDRIDMGAFFDTSPMTFAAPLNYLLQHVDMNPNATMLGVSRVGTSTNYSESTKEDLAIEYQNRFVPMGTKLDELAPPVKQEEEFTTNGARRMWGLFMWRNWDKFSEHHLKAPFYFEDISKHVLGHHPRLSGRLDTRFAGLVLKVRNTITSRWPHRLIHARRDAPSRIDFDNYLSWGPPDGIRWLEWSKVTDVYPEAMLHWLELCYIERTIDPNITLPEFTEIVVKEIEPLISVYYPSGRLVHPLKEEGGESLGEKAEAEAEGEKEKEAGVEESMAGGEGSKKKKKKKKSKKKKK